MASPNPQDRVLIARIAAAERWAREPDRTAATARARSGLMAKYLREVDPDEVLAPDERARRAELLRRAHLMRASRAAVAARARKKRRSTPANTSGSDGRGCDVDEAS